MGCLSVPPKFNRWWGSVYRKVSVPSWARFFKTAGVMEYRRSMLPPAKQVSGGGNPPKKKHKLVTPLAAAPATHQGTNANW